MSAASVLVPGRIFENLRLGMRSLLRRPLRTLLVLQGIIWGVAVAVMPPAILEGSRNAAIEQSVEMGTDRIAIRAQSVSPRPWIDRDDLAAVRERFATVLEAGGGYRAASVEATAEGGEPVPLDLVGAIGDVLAARGQALARGRTFTEKEIRDADPVAILEPEAARALFGDRDPVGRTIRTGDATLEIVGVTAPRSRAALDTDDLGLDRSHPLAGWVRDMMSQWGLEPSDVTWKRSERAVVVPLDRVAAKRPGAIDWMILRVGTRRAPAESAEIERFLGARGRDVEVSINMVWPLLVGGQIDRYMVLNQALFLACLVMGGVVIANLMLLSTLERTREIAIRRTEGATRTDIALQFLTEALLMGIVGSLLGVPLGLGLARVRVALEPVTMIVVIVPWRAVLVSASLAVVTALAAGVLPAIRAANLDPAEALRCQ